MTESKSSPFAAASRRFLPWLIVLFIGSGCAALIYEIIWLQLLQLVIGSSAVSLGVLLGTFMGGMCLGSLLLPRLISSRHHPLRVYAFLEIGIGLLGIFLWFFLPPIARFYAAHAGMGYPAILMRGLVCSICLLPPTILMGATLPAVSRWVESTPQGMSWLGLFYGGNIAGAVFGCLLAGFYLLRVHDMEVATFCAAAINAAVALFGLLLAALTRSAGAAKMGSTGSALEKSPGSRWVYLSIGLSGLTALGAEVIWTRLLSLTLGGTVYTFSIILAVFLGGLGIGSSVGSGLARSLARPRLALAICQMLLTAAIAWSALVITKSLPYWPIDPTYGNNPWINFQLDLARCLWALLPATCLWGASFPLALASVVAPGSDAGRLVGGVYAANTVGAILGSVVTSLLLIGWIGTQSATQVLLGIAALSALVLFVSSLTLPQLPSAFAPVVLALFTIAAATVLIWKLPAVPWGLITEGRYLAARGPEGKCLFVKEGQNASVAVTQTGDVLNFHVSGKIEASSEARDMRLQRMLGDIPALLHPDPHSVLVVGCGAGVTAGSFIPHAGITNIVICEIEPLIPKHIAGYFAKQNYDVVSNSRVHITFDDARNYVLTTKKKFDIITSDPIHPWVKGAASLYTREYFETVKAHLNPGGFVTQWVPLYESNPDVVKSEIATFFIVFTNGTIWANDDHGRGYDIVLLGQVGPTRIDVDALQARLDSPTGAPVLASLQDVGFNNAIDLLGTYAGQASDYGRWLGDAEINHDRDLRLQYLAGFGLNLYQEETIFRSMITNSKYPENIFIATGQTRTKLEAAISR